MVVSLIFIAFLLSNSRRWPRHTVSLGPALLDCFLISDGSQEYAPTSVRNREAYARATYLTEGYGIESLALLYSRRRPPRSPGVLPRRPWSRGSQRHQGRGHALGDGGPEGTARRQHRARAGDGQSECPTAGQAGDVGAPGKGHAARRHLRYRRLRRHLRARVPSRCGGAPGADGPGLRRPRLRVSRPIGQYSALQPEAVRSNWSVYRPAPIFFYSIVNVHVDFFFSEFFP